MAARSKFGITGFEARRLGPPAPPMTPVYAARSGGPMFSDFGMGGHPITTSPAGAGGKIEHLGTVVGRRGAGLTSIGGGDPGAHALGHYGKGGLPGMAGGSFGGGSNGGTTGSGGY